MRNPEVISLLYQIADVLEISGEEETFKVLAYRRAARSIEDLPEDIDQVMREGRLKDVPGVGAAIREKIEEYLTTGKLGFLERLLEGFPVGLLEMLEIQGLGPKKVQMLWRELNVTSVDELKDAAKKRRLRKLKGFGVKTEDKILRAIDLMRQASGRTLVTDAWFVAQDVLERLRAHPSVERAAIAGSLRRRKETVGDLDFLALSAEPAAVARVFTTMAPVQEVVLSGETKSTVILKGGLQADLRVLPRESWGSGLQYFSGSKDHNVRLRGLAQSKGMKLSEYGLFRGEERVAGEDEEGIYGALGLAYIPPEMREASGEIEAAAKRELPDLVTFEDVRGDLHAHTNLTDGVESLPAMAAAAKAMGYAYLGLSEHSPSLPVARGIDVDKVRLRKKEVEGFNRRSEDFKILFGTECEILRDGSLDYADDVLMEFDYVVASVHSSFTLPRKEQTARVIRAVSHPAVSILGHPFTRRVIRPREPIDMHFERVIEAATEHNTALEVNSGGDRMDLNGAQARLAKDMGCKLSTNTDAHSTEELLTMPFAVGLARRGWLEATDVVNTMGYEELRRYFRP